MSFCMYCGRQLNDGEICKCQQTAGTQLGGTQQQAGAPQVGTPQQAAKPSGPNPVAEYINIFKGLFASPVETISSYVAKANIVLMAILIGGQAVINMLTRLFDMLIANSKAKVTIGSKELDSLLSVYTNTAYKPYNTGAIFKNIFLEILLVAVSAAVFALVVMLLVKAFSKVNITYIQGLAIYSIVAVLGIPAELLSWVIGLTSVGFFDRVSTCISVFANVTGYVFIFMAIRALCKDEKKLPLVMGISYVAVSFAAWLIRLMF